MKESKREYTAAALILVHHSENAIRTVHDNVVQLEKKLNLQQPCA